MPDVSIAAPVSADPVDRLTLCSTDARTPESTPAVNSVMSRSCGWCLAED